MYVYEVESLGRHETEYHQSHAFFLSMESAVKYCENYYAGVALALVWYDGDCGSRYAWLGEVGWLVTKTPVNP